MQVCPIFYLKKQKKVFKRFKNYKATKLTRLLFVVLSVFSFFFIFLNTGIRYDLWVLAVFFLIAFFSLYSIFISIDTKGFSLNKSFSLFFYFFFSLAPAYQFKNKTSFFITDYLPSEVYLKYGIILLIILLFYILLYHIGFNYLCGNKFRFLNAKFKQGKKNKDNLIVMYLLVIISFISFMYLIKWDWTLLVYRPFLYRLKYNTNLGFVGYAISLILRLIPFIVLLYYKIQNKTNNKHIYFFLIMLLFANFPTSLSRGVLAIIYIPVFILFIPKLRQGVNYVLLFMGGLLVIFPLFNNFRYLKEGIVNSNFELFNTAHFDAFQNFALLLDENIITNGNQLLGSVLFFIQEAQWENKPNGTGHLLGETIGYSYLNVSMPYFGEGYANWGYLGMVIFLIFIAFFNAFFDVISKKPNLKSWIYSLYLILLGFEFYLMRGDLYSSIKIFSSFLMAMLVVWLLFLIHSKIIKKLLSKV